MEKLFDDTYLVQKERPTKITKQQEEKFYLDLAEQCISDGYSSYPKEIIAEDLRKLSIHDSGFEKAKELERWSLCSYDFSIDFIELLDNISYELYQVLEENVKLWVKAHNPQPKFEKGTKLKIVEQLSRVKELSKDSIVFVTSINMELAYYTISDDKDKNGGYILDFERVESNCEILNN